MAALWPDTIVEEANLAFQVSALRKALEDGGNGESLIQTVPTKGSVRGRGDSESRASLCASSASWRDRRCGAGRRRGGRPRTNLEANDSGRSRYARRAGWHRGSDSPARRSTSSPPVTREPVVTRLTGNPKELPITSAQISPDGRYLAYAGSHRYPRAVHRHGRDPTPSGHVWHGDLRLEPLFDNRARQRV